MYTFYSSDEKQTLSGYFKEDLLKKDTSMQIEFTDCWERAFKGTGKFLGDCTVHGTWYPNGDIVFQTQSMYKGIYGFHWITFILV